MKNPKKDSNFRNPKHLRPLMPKLHRSSNLLISLAKTQVLLHKPKNILIPSQNSLMKRILSNYLGFGIVSYFDLLKVMMIVFLVFTLVNIP